MLLKFSRGSWFALLAALTSSTPSEAIEKFDVVVVGAGIGGLTTALRAAEQGLHVGVVDMAPVFGGHAMLSSGGLCIVGTPLQRAKGIADSPELAYSDFIRLGQDADVATVKLYVTRSRELIFDWLSGLGVKFSDVTPGGVGKTGNSAYRFHTNPQHGFGIVSPIYRECLRKGVTFHWNTQVTALEAQGGRIRIVKGTNLRTGHPSEFEGDAVVLATGGFESNMQLVKKHWPKHFGPVPTRVMLGSGINSKGSGLDLAMSAGGALHRMDHQWIYPRGIPHPAHASGDGGLYGWVVNSISVNRRGERFTDELSATAEAIRAMTSQPGGTHWMLFDSRGAKSLYVAGAEWQDRNRLLREVVENDALVKTAGTLEAVARKAGLPPGQLRATVDRWNNAVASGVDSDFHRQMRGVSPIVGDVAPARIEKPPFHLMQIFPLSRKSMGGIAVDLNSRVLSQNGKPVAGLYAVGETTGQGGLNGRSSLEGTFLGSSIVQGHMAAAHLASAIRPANRRPAQPPPAESIPAETRSPAPGAGCIRCHQMNRHGQAKRAGYWHSEKVHSAAASRALACRACHGEMAPYRPASHRIDRMAQILVCATCHIARE